MSNEVMDIINVVIADDIQILRKGLNTILNNSTLINVVGCAKNGKEAYEVCTNTEVDVVLMDMYMPGYDGSYGIQLIKKHFPNTKILVLTTFDDFKTINAAILSGADGYILKEMTEDVIINSIVSVYNGVNVFCNDIYKKMNVKVTHNNYNNTLYKFGKRELELIHYIASGYDNKEIAEKMYLAEGTVRNNISKLLTKLELKDRTSLAVFAVKNGLDDM